ncbi:hypothetical protein Pmar_PMAR009302 [Perkinsus marinus ATCC 50983]|uniref:Abasic site processing protein n=1 Tax=Perkinsus marinus (strain ATCC 50983 / TXsc) TaxID=423536 RepID=C5KW25_PERM5|nr:hypothetical protein Pmar_PMAR009302 [Perkinsus marinus ATCC 50983]EER11318.1 hypothetical protein Pmar_PMAR009302 [Perkinsus marinus ATCC 50983]|eukprot:XP_002779523.1 hypothetical protein Pmar_PMAR009302 [Perkinsus marinus ATCC 50983]
MTMESAGPVTKIHDRMPVLLTPECAAEWIDRSRASDTALLRKIAEVARETAKQSVTAYEVPTLANNIRNDVRDCLLPLSAWKKKQFDNGLGRFFKKAAKKQETEAPERQPDDAKDPPAKKRKAE